VATDAKPANDAGAQRRLVGSYLAVAALVIVLPQVVRSGFALSVVAQMGIAIVFALSYNMLLGQGGMLSFGHAVYAGLGGYFTIHALAAINQGGFAFPVSLLPLVGGLAGMGFALLLGWVSTRRAGTTFAMISLGVGELVGACVLMLPSFFGGEAGVSANRVTGARPFGVSYGPQSQMVYLIGAWAMLCVAAMHFLTSTPFGRLANAVRDNPERVAFLGYSTHLVRYQQMVLAGLFAGISGALAALNNEIVTIESVGVHASGLVLLMVFIGGMGHFVGPILGAIVVTLLQMVVSTVTHAWLFYFGLLFLAMVLFVPGGLASVLVDGSARLSQPGAWRRLGPSLALRGLALLLCLGGTVVAVESAYARWSGSAPQAVRWGALQWQPDAALPWLAALLLFAAGVAGLRAATWLADSAADRSMPAPAGRPVAAAGATAAATPRSPA